MFSNWQRELDRVPIGFPISYTIYTIAMWLCSLTLIVFMLLISWLLCHMLWLWLWPLCDCCHTFCDSVIVTWYFPTLHPSNKEKKRKRKEILNNDLAILPSHDINGYKKPPRRPFNWYIVVLSQFFVMVCDIMHLVNCLSFYSWSKERSVWRWKVAFQTCNDLIYYHKWPLTNWWLVNWIFKRLKKAKLDKQQRCC